MNEETVRQFRKAFSELHKSPRTINLNLPAVDAYALVLQLQLALKHPENQGPSAAIAVLLAKQIESELGDIDRSLRAELRRGWDNARNWLGIDAAAPPELGEEQLP